MNNSSGKRVQRQRTPVGWKQCEIVVHTSAPYVETRRKDSQIWVARFNGSSGLIYLLFDSFEQS